MTHRVVLELEDDIYEMLKLSHEDTCKQFEITPEDYPFEKDIVEILLDWHKIVYDQERDKKDGDHIYEIVKSKGRERIGLTARQLHDLIKDPSEAKEK